MRTTYIIKLVGQIDEYSVTDFDSAWQKARKANDSYDPTLFASSSYRPQHTTRRQTPVRRNTPSTSSSAVWSEFSGHSSQKGYTYSPALAKAQHVHAMDVFQQTINTLDALKERW